MKTLNQKIKHSIEVKKSNFLSFILPYIEFEEQMQALKTNHPKAVHFVFAYRKIEDGQIIERFSDDGEPKGSSGMPVLNVLRGYDMINVAAIVVRYFGGTLLGVGGLVRAYTQSVVDCIKSHPLALDEYLKKESFDMVCEYPAFSRLKYLAKQYEVEIIKEDFGAYEISLRLQATLELKEAFLQAYQND